jgi:folate-binding protein YgfZ
VHHTVAEALAAFLTPYAMFSKCKVVAHNTPVAVVAGERDSAAFTNRWCFANDLLTTSQSDGHDQSSAIAQDLVANRFAWVSDSIAGKFLPQVLGMHEVGAVDFDKGCYLGQEIVARAQFRGAVKRGIDVFSWHGQAPKAGDNWTDSAHGKGTVILAAATTAADTGQGLWVRSL